MVSRSDDVAAKIDARLENAAQELGRMCEPSGGILKSVSGNRAESAPPFSDAPVCFAQNLDRFGGAADRAIQASS